jgi:hypothetical protein
MAGMLRCRKRFAWGAMQLDRLLKSASSQAPVSGLTHGFYRYPARFSPLFVHSAIEAFTKPMDTVLDPFMGGGTTAVEALAMGRRFAGSDLNSLSVFITRTKTTPLSCHDEEAIREWYATLLDGPGIRSWESTSEEWTGYQINTPWWIRQASDLALCGAGGLDKKHQQEFARSVVLKTAQWALDCKDAIPSSGRFFAMIRTNAEQMLESMRAFKKEMREAFAVPPSKSLIFRRLLHCDAAELASRKSILAEWTPPRLILTSPPYFGVHILYHRWQVQGRRETPTPFWIAASRDGMGASYYTFGARQARNMDYYLSRLSACFTSIAALMDKRSRLVQLVSFSDSTSQLESYLGSLEKAGLREVALAHQEGRFWRTVPNRKWYATLRGGTSASQELLLVHKRA